MGRRRHPFLDQSTPLAIAHRGGACEAPENTAEAFSIATGLGYRYLETDAHVTSDGVVVAIHDDTVDRVTDRTGTVVEMSIAQVEAADAGYRHTNDCGQTFPFRGRGVQIPRLAELLRRWPEARFIIDPKDKCSVDPLARVIEDAGAWDRVCLGSFSGRRLRRLRKLGRGQACTSMGPVATLFTCVTALLGWMPRLGADCIQCPTRAWGIPIVTPRWVRAAHRAGLPVHVWTIDDAPAMHQLLEMGVDGIMTDRPRVLRDVFRERGLPAPGDPLV